MIGILILSWKVMVSNVVYDKKSMQKSKQYRAKKILMIICWSIAKQARPPKV
jgi:hypothetical protein